MANFVALVDHDPGRRADFAKRAESRLCPLDGLSVGRCSVGDFTVLWGAAANAPVSQHAGPDAAAVIFGEAIKEQSTDRVDATSLKVLWGSASALRAFDGYYAAIVFSQVDGVVVGADRLGLFPVYYYDGGDFVLIGSSLRPFLAHPEFRERLDPFGLVGILLTMHPVGGHTILCDVHRLPVGDALRWRPGRGISLKNQFKVPSLTTYHHSSLPVQIDIFDQAHAQAVRRHASSHHHHTLLLSGGLDSRTVGGYLRESQTKVTALTLGLPSDIEMRCARRVAKALGFPHRAHEVPFADYPGHAQSEARWVQGASGFNTIQSWGLSPLLATLSPTVVMGHGLDWLIGYEPVGPDLSFELTFAHHNRWGFSPHTLRRLLRRDIFGDAVDEVINHLRATYHAYSDIEFQRTWRFALDHRLRFHNASDAWRFSFGAWPVLPILDAELITAAAGLPAVSLSVRLLQNRLLCSRFPNLAALPLDQNAARPTLLRPTLRWMIDQYCHDRLAELQRHIPALDTERRFYYRTFDLNNKAWRAVRRAAEPFRPAAYEFFQKEALHDILPAPEVQVKLRDGIFDASSIKSVLGFLFWLGDH